MAKKKVTRKEVLAMLDEGLSVEEIAEKTGNRLMSIKMIADSRKAGELKPVKKAKKATKTKQEIIFEMLDKGMSTNEIHEKIGGSKASIYTYGTQWKNSKGDATNMKESKKNEKKTVEKDLSYYIKQNDILRKKNEELAEWVKNTDELERKIKALTDKIQEIEKEAATQIEIERSRYKRLDRRKEELIIESDKRIDQIQKELQRERIKRMSLLEYVAVDVS